MNGLGLGCNSPILYSLLIMVYYWLVVFRLSAEVIYKAGEKQSQCKGSNCDGDTDGGNAYDITHNYFLL